VIPGPSVSAGPDPRAILGAAQARVLAETAAAICARGFLLGGGTALGLVYGHRRSIDFDWFTADAIGDPMRLAAELRGAGVSLEVTSVDRGTLHGTVDGVRLSLLEYRYPLLAQPVPVPSSAARLLSLDDIGAMKLSAVTQRGSRKDFVDLYVLATRHKPLKQLLEAYTRKFAIADVGHVYFGLAYFDDAESEPMPEMLWPLAWEDVRRSFQDWLKALL
jgi:hypothetical protein